MQDELRSFNVVAKGKLLPSPLFLKYFCFSFCCEEDNNSVVVIFLLYSFFLQIGE
jgi:hypothetical protein